MWTRSWCCKLILGEGLAHLLCRPGGSSLVLKVHCCLAAALLISLVLFFHVLRFVLCKIASHFSLSSFPKQLWWWTFFFFFFSIAKKQGMTVLSDERGGPAGSQSCRIWVQVLPQVPTGGVISSNLQKIWAPVQVRNEVSHTCSKASEIN